MTPEFSVKFIINRILGTFKIELTDTADYTGVATAYGFYKITYPDGIFHENTDVDNPDFELGDFVSEINLRTKNNALITGQYTIQQKIYANTGFFTLTKSFSFSLVEPALAVEFSGNLLTPTVIFEDTTDYNVANYTEAIAREISCNFPAHLPISGTELTSSTTTLDMVDSGNYYEGVYFPSLNVSVEFTGADHTVEWLKESDFEISVKKLLSYDELLTLFNLHKSRIDESIGRQSYKQLLEDYHTISALFDHVQLKIKAGESGIDALMIELQELVYKIDCCNSDEYEYSENPLTEFDYSEVIESGFNIVANADGVDQFTSATNKEIRFEGVNGTDVTFDPLTNKVIISSEEAQGQTEDLELELEALQVNEEDFIDIRFDRIGGYVYGTKENPVTDVAMSIVLTSAKKFVAVKIYHQASSIPTFDLGDTVSIKETGSYITSQLNEIVIIHSGNTNINIAYLNEGESVQDGLITAGVVDITTETTADISGFEWRIAGDLYLSGTVTDLAITGLPSSYDRVDLLVGDSLGDVIYVPGIESEGQPVPSIPSGTILLATLFRNLDGTVVDVPEVDLSDFVSKSALGNQTIQSDLSISAQSGSLPNFTTFDANGKIIRTNPANAGMFTTLEGIGGYSKILTITIDPVNQVNYYAVVQFNGITPEYEKGQLWIQFLVDGSGDIITNKLKLWGELDPSIYTLIKTASDTYELYVAHTDANSFFSFRPLAQFGSSFRYVYHNLESKIDPLPAGDQYFFTSFFSDSTVNDGLVDGGVVTWTGTGYVYDVSDALVRYLAVLLPWIPYDQVTLATADATFPRKDVIVVEFSDSFTGFKAITGPADSVDAVEPQLEDYATQIKLTVIDVAAGSTSPSITGEQIYDENLEWDVESTGTGTVNPASVAAPWVNLYSIEVTNCQNLFRLILNRTTPFDYDSFDVQSLRLKQKSSLGSGQSLGLQFLDSSNAPVTNIVPLSIVKADLNYQYLAVAKESFTPVSANQAQKIAIVFTRVSGGATYSGFFVDDWKIQSGIVQPPTTTTIQLANEVSASGASNAPIPVSLTEKAISNRPEETTWGDNDFLLFWKASNQTLYKIKKSNLGISGSVGITSVVAGAGIDVDVTDPNNPIVLIEPSVVSDIANGVTAFGWGDHASIGYLINAVLSVVAGTGIDVDITDPDNPIVSVEASIITNASNGATAFGWGNHASAGYVEGVTGDGVDNTDPDNPVITQYPADVSTNTIDWAAPKTFGSFGSPRTGTLTESNTGAKKVVQVIFYSGASFTAPSANWKLSANSANYTTSGVNIIYVEYFSDTYKRYWFDQDV